MSDGESGLSGVLQGSFDTILKAWMRDQADEGVKRTDLVSAEESARQSRDLLSALTREITASPSDSGGRWRVTLAAPRDVAVARDAATEAMTELGASVIKRTKFVTAVSEVARNALLHGGGGYIRFYINGAADRRQLTAECVDRGPGIADVEQALRDGFSSGTGLGHGLGGARRLVDSFEIISSAGSGTTVRLTSRA